MEGGEACRLGAPLSDPWIYISAPKPRTPKLTESDPEEQVPKLLGAILPFLLSSGALRQGQQLAEGR